MQDRQNTWNLLLLVLDPDVVDEEVVQKYHEFFSDLSPSFPPFLNPYLFFYATPLALLEEAMKTKGYLAPYYPRILHTMIEWAPNKLQSWGTGVRKENLRETRPQDYNRFVQFLVRIEGEGGIEESLLASVRLALDRLRKN